MFFKTVQNMFAVIVELHNLTADVINNIIDNQLYQLYRKIIIGSVCQLFGGQLNTDRKLSVQIFTQTIGIMYIIIERFVGLILMV